MENSTNLTISLKIPPTNGGKTFVSIRNGDLTNLLRQIESENPDMSFIIKPFINNLLIPTKYAENHPLGFTIGTYEILRILDKWDIKAISSKNKVNINEFLFIYFSDPFRFINISDEDHERIYNAIKLRLPYYVAVRIFHSQLRLKYSTIVNRWIEDDPKLMNLFDKKTYIYFTNLISNTIPVTISMKSIEAVLKGISDLIRFANYSLINAAHEVAESGAISSELFGKIQVNNIASSHVKKDIINFWFKPKTVDSSFHRITLDGSTLIVYLANQLYDPNLYSTIFLNEESKIQLQGYLDQIFSFIFFKFIACYHHDKKSIQECFEAFDDIKIKLNTKTIFFNELTFYKQVSKVTYKKILELLNQIVAEITLEFNNLNIS